MERQIQKIGGYELDTWAKNQALSTAVEYRREQYKFVSTGLRRILSETIRKTQGQQTAAIILLNPS